MAPTEVMMLGRLQPQVRTSFMNPPTTSPAFPQNLLRPSVMSGLGAAMPFQRFIPRAPRAPRFPWGLGQLTVATPGITAARLAVPSIAAGRFGFQTPSAGPGGSFLTPGLSPGTFALGALHRGFGRAKAIAVSGLGQVESVEGSYEDTVDEALLAYDVSLNEADAVLSPQEMEAEILAADVGAPGPGEAVMLPSSGAYWSTMTTPQRAGLGIIASLSAMASLYHGYRRNSRKGTGSALGWGLLWFLMGAAAPGVTPIVGLAQGWGKPK